MSQLLDMTPLARTRVMQCQRLINEHPEFPFTALQLYEATMATWSNLNPQTFHFDGALSVAFVALQATTKAPS